MSVFLACPFCGHGHEPRCPCPFAGCTCAHREPTMPETSVVEVPPPCPHCGDEGGSEWQHRCPRGTARELLCMICGAEHPVWFAPNDLWNAVVRQPDGSEEWPFLCPTCFARMTEEKGVGTMFKLSLAEEASQGTEREEWITQAVEAAIREAREVDFTGDYLPLANISADATRRILALLGAAPQGEPDAWRAEGKRKGVWLSLGVFENEKDAREMAAECRLLNTRGRVIPLYAGAAPTEREIERLREALRPLAKTRVRRETVDSITS